MISIYNDNIKWNVTIEPMCPLFDMLLVLSSLWSYLQFYWSLQSLCSLLVASIFRTPIAGCGPVLTKTFAFHSLRSLRFHLHRAVRTSILVHFRLRTVLGMRYRTGSFWTQTNLSRHFDQHRRVSKFSLLLLESWFLKTLLITNEKNR